MADHEKGVNITRNLEKKNLYEMIFASWSVGMESKFGFNFINIANQNVSFLTQFKTAVYPENVNPPFDAWQQILRMLADHQLDDSKYRGFIGPTAKWEIIIIPNKLKLIDHYNVDTTYFEQYLYNIETQESKPVSKRDLDFLMNNLKLLYPNEFREEENNEQVNNAN